MPDEDVRAEAEDEGRDAGGAGRLEGGGEFVRRGGIVHHVGGTADPERGVWSDGLVAAKPHRSQHRRERRRDFLRRQAPSTRT